VFAGNVVRKDVINNKKCDLLLKFFSLTKEMEGPHLIMDSILLSKEKLQEHLDSLKVSWAKKFNDSIECSKEEVERWLI